MTEPDDRFSHAYAAAVSRETLEELKLVASLSHKGESGRARENILRRFIQRIVPPSLGLEPGFVIDGQGEVSGQIDLVLYRTDYYPVLEVGGVKHFLIESVIAVFEIKASTDSEAKLTQALEQIETVKKLDRTGGGINYTVGTRARKRIDPDVYQCQVFGAVLSERSLSATAALASVERFCESRSRRVWPNIVVAADNYSIRYRAPNGAESEEPGHAVELIATTTNQVWNPPLSDLAVALADIVRTSAQVDYRPSNYWPSSKQLLAERSLPADRFPGGSGASGPPLEEYEPPD